MAQINGTASDDSLNGTLDADAYLAFSGDDVIFGSEGTDSVNGGEGNDTLIFSLRQAGSFTDTAALRTLTVENGRVFDDLGKVNTRFINVEHLQLDDGGSPIVTAGPLRIEAATTTIDVIVSYETAKLTAFMGSGNDFVIAGAFSNMVDGGAGTDRVQLNLAGRDVVVTGTSASATVTSTEGGQSITTDLRSVELHSIWGRNVDASRSNVPTAFIDDASSQTIRGSTAADYFVTISAFSGGSDIYYGGGGADTWDFSFALDSANGKRIMDFDGDDRLDFRFNYTEQPAARFIGDAAFTGVAGQYRSRIVGTTTLVEVDYNGDTIADRSITIENGAFVLRESAPGSNILQLATPSPTPTNTAPTFTSSQAASVVENAAVSTIVYRAIATDAQGDAISFSLSGADATRFEINASTGTVTLKASADYEVKATYDIVVIATDAGSPARSTSQPVSITITDVNEAPRFAAGSRSVSVTENSPASTVLLTGGATDPDAGATLSYSLAGTDAAAFSVNAATGAVTLQTAPDFETRAGYSFTLVATDQAGLSTSQTVNVTVTDVAEATPTPSPTNTAPTFTSSQTASVAENAAVSTIVYRATATDAQGDAISFSLGGADATRFEINASTGTVTLKASADYEVKATYDIVVIATDAGSPARSTSQPVSITITDVNEAPRFAAGSRSVSVTENSPASTVLLTGGATDPDAGATLSYSLAGTDAAAFSVNAATGAVTLRTAPDFETRAGYSFTLVATDQAGLSTNETVNVTVTDVAEGIAQPNFYLLVPAGAATNVQGSGGVFGTTAGTQQVTVLDTPGRVTFDGSFNAGGDRIMLTGPASSYTVLRRGAAAEISDGDTVIVVPVGSTGADIVFSDGVRSLLADVVANVVRLGDQSLTSTGTTITAAAGPPTALGATNTAVASYLLVSSPATVTASGAATVFGTTGGQESVRVSSGAMLSFDGSFNAGGDRVVLPYVAAQWVAGRSGATVLLAGPDGTSVTIPVGLAGMTLRFEDGDRTLLFDASSGSVKLDGLAIGTVAGELPPSTSTQVASNAFEHHDDAPVDVIALPEWVHVVEPGLIPGMA